MSNLGRERLVAAGSVCTYWSLWYGDDQFIDIVTFKRKALVVVGEIIVARAPMSEAGISPIEL